MVLDMASLVHDRAPPGSVSEGASGPCASVPPAVLTRKLDPSAPIQRAHSSRLAPLIMGALLTASLLGLEASFAASPAQAAVPLAAAIPLNATIPAAAGPCVAGWRELPVPDSVFISTPFEVVTRNQKPAWILGGSNDGVLALKWNGSGWKKSATNSARLRGLNGGTVPSANSVLGVGYARPIQEEGGSLDPISGRIVGRPLQGPQGAQAARGTSDLDRRRSPASRQGLGRRDTTPGWQAARLLDLLDRQGLGAQVNPSAALAQVYWPWNEPRRAPGSRVGVRSAKVGHVHISRDAPSQAGRAAVVQPACPPVRPR